MYLKKIITLAILFPLYSSAEIHWVKNENIKSEKVQQAKIIYTGEVNARQVSELISAIDEINNDYPGLKSIKLYITSFGGSMESGYLAMQAIKGSTIPVEAINAGMTGSSATLMYCGAQKRYALPLASFMLHPAATPNIKSEWIRPNDLELMKKDVDDGNNYFRNVYKNCTSLSNKDINEILFSNDGARYLLANDAESIKLSQGIVSGIMPTPVSYYITGDNK
ncbi:ATP-dependent Clp protease proteolytic subunit [Serratia ureilytica]|uniref:ATP-dependent Clp protease proteolytic subunit n=1 Tax=Serratia ureilytica TaxID=300181 RepID=UPI00191ED02F|nr:ATP-dependent Clp protease proteolytic subunit [Serratia ureilytica]MBL0881069.1 peptidase S14 [Serratia ureilytica]